MKLYEDERLDYLLAEELNYTKSICIYFFIGCCFTCRFACVPIQKGKLLIYVQERCNPPFFKYTDKRKNYGVEIQERLYNMAKEVFNTII